MSASISSQVCGRVGERHPDELGLCPVDSVAEDPAPASKTLAIAALAAEAARPAGGDARDQHLVAGGDRLDPGTNLFDGPHRLVTENPPFLHRRHVTFEYVEVGAADGDGVDTHDGIGVVDDHRLGDLVPGLLGRSVIDHGSHRISFQSRCRPV
jgi:hypothetical protein